MGRKTVEERFWEKVNKTDGCWLWTGAVTRKIDGYGRFVVDGRVASRTVVTAHRWAWEQENGPVPANLELDHTCETTLCVRPAHIESVPHCVNMMRGSRNASSVNAKKRECTRGHPFNEDNTYLYNDGRSRMCRACHREQTRQWAATPERRRIKQIYDRQRRKSWNVA